MKKLALLTFIFVTPLTLGLFGIAKANGPTVFMIGNSLTYGALPNELGVNVDYHVQTNNNLHQIHTEPFINGPGSIMWEEALINNQYDVLIVQIYKGSTLEQDFAAIVTFAELQPNADIIIFTGWPMHTIFAERYHSGPDNELGPSLTYVSALQGAVQARYPDRTVTITEHMQALETIRLDHAAGVSAVGELSNLYRDETHLSLNEGRYLSHNLIRKALGLPVSTPEGLEIEAETLAYLNIIIQGENNRLLFPMVEG